MPAFATGLAPAIVAATIAACSGSSPPPTVVTETPVRATTAFPTKPAAPQRNTADAPRVLVATLAASSGASDHVTFRILDPKTGGFTLKYENDQRDISDFVVDAKTGRFVIGLRQATAFPVWDGRRGDISRGQTALYAGDLARGIRTVDTLDPLCAKSNLGCFMHVEALGADPDVVYVDEVYRDFRILRGYHLDGQAPFTIVSEHDVSAVSEDRSQLVVVGQGGLYVAAMPPPGTRATLSRVIDVPRRYYYRELVHAGSHAVGFVEALADGRAYVELVDLKGKRRDNVFEAPQPKHVDWTHGIRYVSATRSVVFATGLGEHQPGSLYALSIDSGKARKLADDVHDLFDTSADGRWAIVAVPVRSSAMRSDAETLGLVDLATGKIVARFLPPDPTTAFVDLLGARFVP